MNKLAVAGCMAPACLASSLTLAADIDGGVSVGVAHSDNVFLTVAPTEMDDLVWQASPFFSIVHESPNLDFNVDYALDWYRLEDVGETSNYDHGEISVTGRAWEDTFSAELGANRSQTLSDPDGVIPQSRLPFSRNLVDQDVWWFAPTLNRSFGNEVSLEADYRYSKVQYDDSRIQDNTYQLASLGIDNYDYGRGFAWALRYEWRRDEFEVSDPWENQRATVELGTWANDRTRVFGAAGKESSWNNPFDPSMEDSFWEVGAAYSPGKDLLAVLAAGERSFGSSWRARVDYNFPRGSMWLSYGQSPTTTGFGLGSDSTGLPTTDDALVDYLNRPGSAERFISERFDWNVNLKYRRSEVHFSVFDEKRSDRVTAVGQPADDQAQTGIKAEFTLKAGVRTALTISGILIDQETGLALGSKLVGGGVAATYRLGAHTDLKLSYEYTDQQPRTAASAYQDYVANVVSLLVTYSK